MQVNNIKNDIVTQINIEKGHVVGAGHSEELPAGVTPDSAQFDRGSPVSNQGVETVFVSHATEDRAIAFRVDTALRRLGIPTWMAERNISPGQRWDDAIVEGINGAWLLVLLYSESAGRSPHVRSEIRLATDRKMALLPVRLDRSPLEKAIEYWITGFQWMDGTHEPADLERRVAEAVQRLSEAD
jgi:hypothetical protein